jgi:RNA polymerase sigma factor (sigma-70 family)
MSAGLVRLAARSAGATDGPSDALLLDWYVAGRDEAAFALLVARHGPTVLGVCRRVLGNGPDADDAFQATFLVLVRKASAVRDRDRLAGWLYGVAHRTALEARTRRAKRWRRESPTDPLPDAPAVAADRTEVAELAAVIDQEIHRLPEKYRAAVVLCDLDGRPRTEAAQLLGVPEGTLSSRLAEGRKRLGDRLARRERSVAAVSMAVIVPDRLAAATVRSAIDGGPAVVHELAKGVLHSMIASKLKLGVLALVPTAVAVTGLVGGSSAAPEVLPPTPAAVVLPAMLAAPAENVAVPDGGDKKVADARPVVVKTVPVAGTEDVDPGIKEVRVTFSKEMMDKSWSWATDTGHGAFPEIGGEIHYDKDNKTCILPCKLQPGTTYAVWINVDRFMNFKDVAGRPAVPYLLVFRTKEAK